MPQDRRYRGIFDFSDEVDTDRLRPVTRWLLEAMVQDHLTALRTAIHRFRTVLEPALSSPRGENANSKSATGTETPGTWANQVLSLFATIDQMEQLAGCLFVGASLPGGPEENPLSTFDSFQPGR